MITAIVVLLLIWLALSVAGFVIKGLLWLGVVGIVLFVVTAAWGVVKRNTSKT